MKKRRTALLALVVALAMVLCLAVRPRAGLADFGDFSGDSDWGGSDWGDSDWGDSDWDDDDWDWGDSGTSWDWDDDDWGSSSGSSWGSGYSTYSTAGSAFRIFSLLGGGMTTLVTIIVILIIVRRMSASRRGSSGRRATRPTYTGVPKPFAEEPTFRGRDIATYTEVDPNFDISAFKERLSNLYVQMQHAWTDRDIEPVRQSFSPELYAQMERQVKQKISLGQTNHVDRIAVMSVEPKTWYQEGGYDHIVAVVKARIVDYTVDDATGNLVSGSMTAEKFMTYQWDLSRESGTVTTEQPEQVVVNCPNCGAPLNINATAKCPYCDSVVEVRHNDWAITSIKGISQVTR